MSREGTQGRWPRVASIAAAVGAAVTVLLLAGRDRPQAPSPANVEGALATATPAAQPAAPAATRAVPAEPPAASRSPLAAVLPASMPEPAPIRIAVLTVRLARDQTLAQALSRLPLGPGQAQAILGALADKFPFGRSRPGDQLRVERVEGEAAARRFTYRQSAADEWTVTLGEEGRARGQKRAVTVTTEVGRIDVPIQGSLWESLQRAGEDPSLAALAADALAFDVDFYQEARAGDRLRLLVEKVLADGKLLRYGEVLAATYAGEVTGEKRLFRYTDPTGFTGYYDDQGRPARRGFLRSPLRYAAHLTSGFGSRVHPLLGYVKAHQGVDYGAPTGTAVMAVSDGTVARAGWMGGCGNAVTLHHPNGLETVYCHLSSIAVHVGARIAQRQLVGLVGQTGMATGPHLHFAVRRGGAFVNPLTVKVPRSEPLAPTLRADFLRQSVPLRARLEAVPMADATEPASAGPRG